MTHRNKIVTRRVTYSLPASNIKIGDSCPYPREENPGSASDICADARYWEQPARERYINQYGLNFNEKSLHIALSRLKNKDGSTHEWTCEQVAAALKPLGVILSSKNKYNACYAANMLYSDYFDGTAITEAMILRMTAYKMGDIDAKEGDIYTMWEAKMMNHCVKLEFKNFL